jgi:hypothetical protein
MATRRDQIRQCRESIKLARAVLEGLRPRAAELGIDGHLTFVEKMLARASVSLAFGGIDELDSATKVARTCVDFLSPGSLPS